MFCRSLWGFIYKVCSWKPIMVLFLKFNILRNQKWSDLRNCINLIVSGHLFKKTSKRKNFKLIMYNLIPNLSDVLFKQGNKIVYLNCTFYLTAFWNSRPTVKDAVEKWFCVEKILRKKQKNIGMLFYVPIDLTMYFIQLTFVFSIWHKASKETKNK